jgi:Zn finger protein HypA/HybF involved in hydrogenase expression
MSIMENEIFKTANFLVTPVEVETACLICGEGIVTWLGDYIPKICEKCRGAVMAMRKKLED